jgi:endonuclease-8
MPEGDTILRTARALDRSLAGRPVTAFTSPLPAVAAAARRLGLVGRTVEGVQARGKHLLVAFSGGPVLHTHQGMRGSWHLYRPGRPWPLPAPLARAVIETEQVLAVCFLSPTVELLSAGGAASHPGLARLGPDPLQADFDATAARARLRARDALEIAPALLDQGALAGVGNVYKSEILHVCGLSPFSRVRDLDDAVLDRLIATARDLMKRNLAPRARRTTSERAPFRLFVYGRGGRPCPRCGATIRWARQGRPPRSTWWCPGCQPDPRGRGAIVDPPTGRR